MLSMACEQEVRRDRDPKCVTADKRNFDEHCDNRQPCENQGDKEYDPLIGGKHPPALIDCNKSKTTI
jgi:hypothetical protein